MDPEHAPHFGRLWEAAVKSLKNACGCKCKLTFEECSILLTQIEACVNSRPIVPLPQDDDGVEAFTPGHFLIGRPLEALPDPAFSYHNISLLLRWHLCQSVSFGSVGWSNGTILLKTFVMEMFSSYKRISWFLRNGQLPGSLKHTLGKIIWSGWLQWPC